MMKHINLLYIFNLIILSCNSHDERKEFSKNALPIDKKTDSILEKWNSVIYTENIVGVCNSEYEYQKLENGNSIIHFQLDPAVADLQSAPKRQYKWK